MEAPELIVKQGDTFLLRMPFYYPHVHLKGTVQEEVANLTADPAKSELVIKDASGVVQSLIDENGNLKMRGKMRRNY